MMANTSAEVRKRWRDKAYKQYTIYLRVDDDALLIELIDKLKSKGLQTTEIFRYAMQLYLDDYEKNQG